MHQLTRKDLVLLGFLILFWGLNWPVMKASVRDFPPLSFRSLSMIGGLAAIALIAKLQRASLRIPPGQVMTVVKLAIPNMLIWHACIIIGVKMLSSGRAAILGYTMPVWAVLSGLLFFGDRIHRRAMLGILLAMLGAGLLLSSEFAHIADDLGDHTGRFGHGAKDGRDGVGGGRARALDQDRIGFADEHEGKGDANER